MSLAKILAAIDGGPGSEAALLAAPEAAPAPGKFAVCFDHVVGCEADHVLRRGPLSDLIVIARPGPDSDGAFSPTFDAARFDSGRPVLLVPAEPMQGLGTTVAVAWDRSREATRAVSAALPILLKAVKVVILSARESGNEAEPSELARYLAAHGLRSRTWAFTPDPGSLGDALLGEAAKAEADLLVLGGVTRGVLNSATVPVLMVH